MHIKRDFLSLVDVTAAEIEQILSLAAELKQRHTSGEPGCPVVIMSGHGTVDTAVARRFFGRIAHATAEPQHDQHHASSVHPTISLMSIRWSCRPWPVCGESITTLRPSGLKRASSTSVPAPSKRSISRPVSGSQRSAG